MKRFIFLSLILTGIAAFSAAQATAFRQEGIASWYGQEFAGRPTASGEIFNPGQYTAAHPTLPFGTVLTVTNKHNMSQVVVRVNDRGPFVAARIIDLSMAAAEAVGMILTGTAPVTIEQTQNMALGPVMVSEAPVIATAATVPEPVITTTTVYAEPATPVRPKSEDRPSLAVYEVSTPPVTAAPEPYAAPAFFPAPAAVIMGKIPPAESAKSYRLQVGSFKVPRNAVDAFEKLKNAGLNPAYEQNGDLYRVVLAGVKAKEIQSIAQILGNTGFREALIREEN